MASAKSEEYAPMTPVDKAEDRPYVEVGGTSAIPRVKPPVSRVLVYPKYPFIPRSVAQTGCQEVLPKAAHAVG